MRLNRKHSGESDRHPQIGLETSFGEDQHLRLADQDSVLCAVLSKHVCLAALTNPRSRCQD